VHEIKKKVAVIGLGRVGLPLSLFLETLGFQVIGIDKDLELLSKIRSKSMPFHENGCDELLEKSNLTLNNIVGSAAVADHIIITVGTPLSPHIEADLSNIRTVLRELIPVLHPGQNIILRSTVAPQTTLFLKQYIEMNTAIKIGRDIGLSFCPERLAENHALEELRKLPQIIGSDDPFSRESCKELFDCFGVTVLFTSTVAAELVKLFNNTARYVEFAMANQFAIIADQYKSNIHELIEMANIEYPRGQIHSPGFTAGSCLRKDFGFISEKTSAADLLLAAWKVNEYMPFHLVDALNRREQVYGKNVAVLGYTFKKNTDDIRDSLVPKLIHYIERCVPKSIKICEPNLKEVELQQYPNLSLEETLRNSDIVFIAVNHDQFESRKILSYSKAGTWFVDLWNCLKCQQVIFQIQNVVTSTSNINKSH